MGLLATISYRKTATAFIFFLLPAVGVAQQYTTDKSAATDVFQEADSLHHRAYYDSSNVLFQQAVDLFEREGHWQDAAESLYKISVNKTKQGQLDEATDYLEEAYSLFQTRELQNPKFKIKYFYQKSVIDEQRADFSSALEWAEKGLDRAYSLEEAELLTAKLSTLIGDIFIAQGDYQKALEQIGKAEDLYHHKGVNDQRLLSHIYNSYGRVYRSNGDPGRALQYFKQSLELDREIYPLPHPKRAQVQNNIAISYYYQGDYQRALDYFRNATNVLGDFHGQNHRLVAAGYNNVGIVYSEMGELEKAAEYLEKSLRIKEEILGETHPDIAIGYQNLGAIYYDMENYDQAIAYYKKSEELHLHRFPEGHPELANVYANLGEAYEAKEMHKKALDYFQKDLNINLERLGNQHPFIGDTFTQIGRTYARIENFDMALNYYRRALEVLVPGYNRESGYEDIPFEQVAHPYLLLETLKLKASALQADGKQSGRQNMLEESLQTYLQVVELVDYLQRLYSREKSKFVLRERASKIYQSGFKLAYLLFEKTGDSRYKEYAFYFAEKSQNQILLAQVQKLNARDLAQIPDTIIDKEQNLQSRITGLQTQISDLAGTPQQGDSLQRVALQDSLFQTRKKLTQHIQYLESSYPKYYELKYKPIVTRAEEIQQDILSPNQVMVSYYFGEEALFALVISKQTFEIRKFSTDSQLQQEIRNYRESIVGGTSTASFAARSHQLYTKLINPIADLISGKDLIIVPSGILNYLPFESLVTDAVSDAKAARFHNLSYLVQDHTISYAPSAGYLHLRNQTKYTESRKKFIGFAPGFSNTTTRNLYSDNKRSVASLPLSQKEVEELGHLFNDNNRFWSFLTSKEEQADIYTGANATEESFKNLPLQNYQYIHLATHAYASEEQPGILFSSSDDSEEDGTLQASEIYNLQLNADLVTLSACETGIGILAEGEGIMSLSRAFQYAGAQNLLVSLWQVSDRSTARLMVDFYKLNQQEKDVSGALRKAKLNMIGEGEYSHPKYWAPFVFIGK